MERPNTAHWAAAPVLGRHVRPQRCEPMPHLAPHALETGDAGLDVLQDLAEQGVVDRLAHPGLRFAGAAGLRI